MSDLRLKSKWSEGQCAQCEGAIKVHHTEVMLPLFSIKPWLSFAKLGRRGCAFVELALC